MQIVAIGESDLTWLGDAGRAETVLSGVGHRVTAIAQSLDGGKVGPTSEGIAVVPGPADRHGLSGWAENRLVSFVLDVRAMGGSDRWDVEAEVYVPCDHRVDCGQHLVESNETPDLTSGADVLEAVDTASRWLLDRATTVSADQWRGLDPRRAL